MRCPICKREGVQSRVYEEYGVSHLLSWSAYYDEDGKYHAHDPNRWSNPFRCSRGHRFEVLHSPCASCGWRHTAPDGEKYFDKESCL